MVANSLRWTTRDLAAMQDDGGWKRHEIIDGELFVTRAPHIRHQGAAGKIHMRLEAWSETTGLGSAFQTPGVIFTPNDAVIPDVVWISRERLINGVDDAGHLIVPPELMVEVLSPGELNKQRDEEVKLKLYARYDVQEYWIVNWQLKLIEVYRRNLDTDRLQSTGAFSTADTLTSPLFPDFSLAIADIFLP